MRGLFYFRMKYIGVVVLSFLIGANNHAAESLSDRTGEWAVTHPSLLLSEGDVGPIKALIEAYSIYGKTLHASADSGRCSGNGAAPGAQAGGNAIITGFSHLS